MKFQIKLLKWIAGRPVAILHKEAAKRLSLHVNDRISIKKGKREIDAVIDLAVGFIRENEISVSKEIIEELMLKEDDIVEVSPTAKPLSIEIISKKLKCEKLSKKEIFTLVNDIVNNVLTEVEIAYFVSAVYYCKISMEEIVNFINAMVKTGERLSLNKKYVVDKHCIGGVAGNRTTPIVVSICASAGLAIPKTSSRAITSAAGTADVIETIAKVDFPLNTIKRIIKKTNGCMVWGGSLGIAPSDDKLIQIERVLNLDPEPQLLASIMAKKIAVGSKYVLIDIPYGKTAKVNKKQAIELKRKFEKISKKFKIKLICVLTNGNQPIGNGIGPVLEMRDVIFVLKNNSSLPLDLKEKSLFLCSKIFELTGKVKDERQGFRFAKEILESGKAFKKFKQIIEEQEGHIDFKKLALAEFKHDIKAKKNSQILEIDNEKINYLSRVAGCPADKSAGLYLWKHVGGKIKKGEKIVTIYAETKEKLAEAVKTYKRIKPIRLK